MSTASPARFALYGGLNLGFVALLTAGSSVGGPANPRLVHLVLLFALCASPVIDFGRLNGKFALMGLFSLVYFVSYGVGDLNHVLTGDAPTLAAGLFSEAETVIFVGGILWIAGYRLAVSFVTSRTRFVLPRNWSRNTTLYVGIVLWAVGTYATYRWTVYIVPDTTNEAVRKGLGSISTIAASAYILAQMVQPLGILLLAYVLYAFKSRHILPLLIGVVVLQVALGFVADIKGMAMYGGALVIVTCVLVTGRVPKGWIAAAVLFVVFVFPIFTAYRTAIHGNLGLARTAVIANFGKVLQMSIAAQEKVNTGRDRAQTFLERSSLKSSVDLIVRKTGNGVDFQHGHTLTPILATFVPKIVWPDKPDVLTGQLVNKQFHISDSDDVYISPSHLGELYWNFGWPGVIVGMNFMGLLCGYVGARCDMSRAGTVTRLLVLVLTTKQLILGFEGVIAPAYVVWLRSLAAVGVLHLAFGRVSVPAPVPGRRLHAALIDDPIEPSAAAVGKPFPNLLS